MNTHQESSITDKNTITPASPLIPTPILHLDFTEQADVQKNSEALKTSLRLQYEAQVEVIKKQIGDLEQVREKLGLSQRKICQLLMVDPSSWSRWVSKGDPAPPQVYRALQWYMALNEKIPGLTPQYFIGKDPEVLHQVALRTIDKAIVSEKQNRLTDLEQIKLEILGLKTNQEVWIQKFSQKIIYVLVFTTLLSAGCLGLLLYRAFVSK